MIDIDFSLAIHNRTGKYYLGLDIIDALADRVDTVLYGRFKSQQTNDIARRILGRIYHWETQIHAFRPQFGRLIPKIRRPNIVLHLDPLTVLNHQMEKSDIVLCHDVGPITHPHCFTRNVSRLYDVAYKDIVKVGCHLVFISVSSQREFHRLYGSSFASSTVIYIPTREAVTSVTSRRPTNAPMSGRYFLTVGSLGDRKNQFGSIKAFIQSGL